MNNKEQLPHIEAQPRSSAVNFNLGHMALDRLTAFALLDETTVASQIRSAISHYCIARINDPELSDLIDNRRQEITGE